MVERLCRLSESDEVAEAERIENEAVRQSAADVDMSAEDLSAKSYKIEDAALERLYTWVRENGGVFNCESRADAETGVRGLYTIKEMTDANEPII